MPPARSASGWLAFGLLAVAAHVLAIAGVALVLPALTLGALWLGGAQGAPIAVAGARLGATFLVAGLASGYLAASGQKIFPNERTEAGDDRPAVGGWLILLAVTLAALPVWLLLQLEPLVSLSTDIVVFVGEQGLWEEVQRDAQFSGLIMMPVMAVLAVPGLEALTAASFLAGSTVLLVLLATRSPQFPRAFVMCALLQGAFAMASVDGVQLAARGSAFIEQAVREGAQGPAPSADARRALAEVQRYRDVVSTTAAELMWTWAGYLLWLPALFASGRIERTFAAAPRSTVSPPTGLAVEGVRGDRGAVLADEESRAGYYAEVARLLNGRQPRAGAVSLTILVAAVGSVLFMFLLMYVAIIVLRRVAAP